jgi:hypothetical protein
MKDLKLSFSSTSFLEVIKNLDYLLLQLKLAPGI